MIENKIFVILDQAMTVINSLTYQFFDILKPSISTKKIKL